MAERFRLFVKGEEVDPSPVEFYNPRHKLYAESEQLGFVYDALWDMAEGGEALPGDLKYKDIEIKADEVTWERYNQ